ncbi:MAG: ArsR/SmtB family transcription factor [Ornithinimicrobium sp.]|jgi:DNA-binding transcriptional ArsR family regulator|uniref:ArsR/SmtB family transcription factor n=1 Tax=Ornithinimicrobium sp. TaxID=1977084 RepID=UPI003D9BBC60
MVNYPAGFAALGDPTRTQIVGLLTQGDRTVSELADQFPISLQGTMKHGGVLEGAGLVSRSKSGRTVTVRLDRAQIAAAETWLHRTRTFWTHQLDNLAHSFEERS